MDKSEYNTRNYRQSDFESLAALVIKQNEIYGLKESARDFSERLKRPGFQPEKDLFVAEVNEHIVGYAQLTIEAEIDRVHLRGWIEPAHRRKSLAGKLLNCVDIRTGELGITSIHTSIYQENRIAREVLPRLGFRYFRRYIELNIDTEKIPREKLTEAVRSCRQLETDEEEKLMALQNRAFSNHWSYVTYTLDRFHYDINLNNRSYRDIIVTSEGNRIKGYCWTEISEVYGASCVEKRGTINMLGVEPEFQGQGTGRTVLLASLAYLKEKKVKSVSLSVDSINRTAYELYRSTGFNECSSVLWYEKKVNQKTGTR